MKCDFVMADAHAQAGHVICKLADEKKADAIIMGQRRLGEHYQESYLGVPVIM